MENSRGSPERSTSGSSPRYVRMRGEPPSSSLHSHRHEHERIFDELPKATVVAVSRSDSNDLSQIPLLYTIQIEYKQFKWQLVKKASQVFYLHFSLKKRAIIEELHEKQEQVKEWLQSLGIGEQHTVAVSGAHDEDEHEEDLIFAHQEEIHQTKSRISRLHGVTDWHFLAQRCSL